jgi:hypothetical protein
LANPLVFYPLVWEVTVFSEDNTRGEFTVEQKKKKHEIFEERGNRVVVPPDVSEEKKKALAQKGEDATGSW